MIADADPLPDDLELLKALVREGRRELAAKDAELARAQDANARLWETLRQLRRTQFGRKSEKLDPDQFGLVSRFRGSLALRGALRSEPRNWDTSIHYR
jgi:hypothetical protein